MMTDYTHLQDEIRLLAHRELDLQGDVLLGDLSENLDSMQRLSLVVAIEDHYEICFDPEDEQGTLTFQDVVTLVQRKLQQRAADAS